MGGALEDLEKQIDQERARAQAKKNEEARKKAEEAAKKMQQQQKNENHSIL